MCNTNIIFSGGSSISKKYVTNNIVEALVWGSVYHWQRLFPPSRIPFHPMLGGVRRTATKIYTYELVGIALSWSILHSALDFCGVIV